MARHWHLDHAGPRAEADVSAAAAEISRHLTAARESADLEDDAVS